ncbi:MAG: hypothetical protein CR991_00505 [Proteobacteria bacterium]|nr:MAG: hypothetical protein CR991_00505 [Pseudomonadota bacterium]
MNFKKNLLAVAVAVLFPLNLQAADQLGFTYDGKEYSGDTLPPAIQNQFYELENKINEQRQEIIDQYILENYIISLAKEQNKAPEEVAGELMKVPEPDEAALKKFYDEHWDRIQIPFEDIKGQLGGMLRQQQQQAKLDALLESIKKEKNYTVQLPQPKAPHFEIKTKSYPSQGKADAPVLVHEFSDFQCPHCKQAAADIHKLMEEMGDQVRLVFRYMPIHPSGISRKIAEGGVCANEQGKFWEYQDMAFAQQTRLKKDSPLAFAKELGLDEDKFKACFEGEQAAEQVRASEEEGRNLGVSGTPTFFINGQPFNPQFDLIKELKAAIQAALAKTEATTATKTAVEKAAKTETHTETEKNPKPASEKQ